MDWQLTWWAWLIIGMALLVVEIMTPGGFYFLFFGVGAVVTGLVQWLLPMGVPAQAILFFAVSFSSLALLRRPMLAWLERKSPTGRPDAMLGEIALPQTEIPASGTGQAELRGTLWNVRNLSSKPLAIGQRCRVVQVDGLTLHLQPETNLT